MLFDVRCLDGRGQAPIVENTVHVPVGIGYLTIRGKSIRNTFGGPGIRVDKLGMPRGHDGWDLACNIGVAVYAVLDAEVAMVSQNYGGYGRSVIIKVQFNGKAYFALYAHLKSTLVNVGDTVYEGATLGFSGQTGNAAGQPYQDAHLHFELRTGLNGPAVDPGLLLGYGALGDVLRAELNEAFSALR